jgi:biopolymer transport protein ExbD
MPEDASARKLVPARLQHSGRPAEWRHLRALYRTIILENIFPDRIFKSHFFWKKAFFSRTLNITKMKKVLISLIAVAVFLSIVIVLAKVLTSEDHYADFGLNRQLPPLVEQGQPSADKRNKINVYIDGKNQLFVNDTLTDIISLCSKIKNFLDIHSEGQGYPEKHLEDIPGLGAIKINSMAMVTLQNGKNTSYGFYIQVQNELVQAFHELRDELSVERFGTAFDKCSEEEQNAVEKVYPLAISEAEPKQNE